MATKDACSVLAEGYPPVQLLKDKVRKGLGCDVGPADPATLNVPGRIVLAKFKWLITSFICVYIRKVCLVHGSDRRYCQCDWHPRGCKCVKQAEVCLASLVSCTINPFFCCQGLYIGHVFQTSLIC